MVHSDLPALDLEATTAATTLLAGSVCGDRGDVLDATDLDAATCERAHASNTARARGAGASATSAADLEVEGVDADILQLRENLLGRHHSGIRRGLVAVRLDLSTASVAADGLAAR